MNIIFTMAVGEGRVRKDGTSSAPIFSGRASGRPLLAWSLESLRHFYGENFIFVTAKGSQNESLIHECCESQGIAQYTIKELNSAYKGQASAAFAAKSAIEDPREPITIFGPTVFISPSEIMPRLIQGDGWIPCYHTTGPYSACLYFDQMQRVTEVANSGGRSDFAAAGFFYFRSFELFESCRKQCHYIGHKEQSVPPLYTVLTSLTSKSIFTFILSSQAVHLFGTPAQARDFEAWASTQPVDQIA